MCETNALPLTPQQTAREVIRLKRPELWTSNSWFLHHDNAPSHTALVLRDHFVTNCTYAPDLASCDFRLFPKLKRPLRGTRFESIEELKAESKKALMARLFGMFRGLENMLVKVYFIARGLV